MSEGPSLPEAPRTGPVAVPAPPDEWRRPRLHVRGPGLPADWPYPGTALAPAADRGEPVEAWVAAEARAALDADEAPEEAGKPS